MIDFSYKSKMNQDVILFYFANFSLLIKRKIFALIRSPNEACCLLPTDQQSYTPLGLISDKNHNSVHRFPYDYRAIVGLNKNYACMQEIYLRKLGNGGYR